MPDFDSLLDEMLEAWEYARQGFIDEAELFTDEEFDGFRPAPESRTPGELCRHVLESGLMGVGELTNPQGDFRRQGFRAHMEEHAGHLPDDPSRSELLDLLRSSLEEGVRRLRDYGEIGMLQGIRRFDGAVGTRFAWFQHSISHEDYHRGQLALYNRLCGRVPALTRRIQGSAG